jgi:hypothetical protein
MKAKIILVVALLVVVFLLGFVPQNRRARSAEQELSQARASLEARDAQLRMAQLRDLATLMHLEAARRNYRSAGEYSTRFFDRLSDASRAAEDPALQATLRELLELRDSITSRLAQGDAAAVAEIQSVLLRLHEQTGAAEPPR